MRLLFKIDILQKKFQLLLTSCNNDVNIIKHQEVQQNIKASEKKMKKLKKRV